jgi:hypothetical protein
MSRAPATAPASPIDRRLLARARDRQAAHPVMVLVGGCGCGRTERLRRLQRELGDGVCQYVDLERVSTTPERCYQTVVRHSPFACEHVSGSERPASARDAYDALLHFLMSAQGPQGEPAIFLLDEVLEVRTFESFPGLRSALPELARALANSPNHFVLSTRFAARAERWVQTARDRFEVVVLDPVSVADLRDALEASEPGDPAEAASAVHALVGGNPGYARSLVAQMTAMRTTGAVDPISALAAALAPEGELSGRCRFSYELRLHRARGYGALKAILDVLADAEPLTLTAIAQRLERTPGSTKDYLSWLQDVDLIACTRKKYRFTDPLLRLWVRLHGGPVAPDEERVAIEVQTYAMDRLSAAELVQAPAPAAPAAPAPAPAPPAEERAGEPGTTSPAPETPAPTRDAATDTEAVSPVRERIHAAAGRSLGSGIIEID